MKVKDPEQLNAPPSLECQLELAKTICEAIKTFEWLYASLRVAASLRDEGNRWSQLSIGFARKCVSFGMLEMCGMNAARSSWKSNSKASMSCYRGFFTCPLSYRRFLSCCCGSPPLLSPAVSFTTCSGLLSPALPPPVCRLPLCHIFFPCILAITGFPCRFFSCVGPNHVAAADQGGHTLKEEDRIESCGRYRGERRAESRPIGNVAIGRARRNCSLREAIFVGAST